MKAITILLIVFAISSCWAHDDMLHTDHESIPEVSPLSLAEINAHADADYSHHIRHIHPSHSSLAGLHSLHRQAVAEAMDSEPCYPKPCIGQRQRRKQNIAASIVQVPVPVPVYVNKVRVVKVKVPEPKQKKDSRSFLLKVQQPPTYTSPLRQYKNSVIEADKRALINISTKITNRRTQLDRHDHWALDAQRSIEVVKKEIAQTEKTKEIVKKQIDELVAMRTRWTNKLKADELRHDIKAAQRSLVQLKQTSEAKKDTVMVEHSNAAVERLNQLKDEANALPEQKLDLEELESF